MTNKELLSRTKSVAKAYLQIEAELVALLIEMDSRSAFKELGYASLFQYCVLELGLSEAVTSAFITVSRKAAKVPDLMLALEDQTLTVSKAAKITSALDIQDSTTDTKITDVNKEIIKFAASHSTAETEKWLREKKGQETFHSIKLGSKIMAKLKQVRELSKEALSLEEALEIALDEYIQKHDPAEKAKRSQKRNEAKLESQASADSSHKMPHKESSNASYPALKSRSDSRLTPQRRPIPPPIKHQIFLKAQNQCSHVIRPGLQCQNRKFLEIHHIKPVHQGGSNEPMNLKLLCSAHHRQIHGE